MAVMSGGGSWSTRQRNLAVTARTRSIAVAPLIAFAAYREVGYGHRDAGGGSEDRGQSPSAEDLVHEVVAAQVMSLAEGQVIDHEQVEHVTAVKLRWTVVA